MADIELSSINKFFGKTHVIKDFSLNIKSQSFTTLVGPSGCGKSTLLRMIAGLEETNSGKISIGGEEVNNLPPKERNIAMVFQSYALYPHMTVFDNMAFGLKLEKRPKDEVKDRVHEAAKILQIEDYLLRKPKQLSGGQRQRVAIGRAITRNPKIFLFDEPLSNLDAALRAEMRVEISKLHNQIKTNMIYVTHDQVEAMTLADRIVILNHGNIEQVGTPDEIYSDPSNIFVAQFIGTPKMNILKITSENIVSNNQINFLGNNIKIDGINFSKKDYYLGIRPEHFNVSENSEYKFNPKVDLVENLGNEKIVYIKMDQYEISAKIPSNHTIENTVGFNSKDIFVFDENGKRIKS